MRVIDGKSDKDKFTSIDNILEGILKKQDLLINKMNKKNRSPYSFNVSNYVETCESGDIICSHFSLAKMKAKKAVIVIKDFDKDANCTGVLTVEHDNGTDEAIKVILKRGINAIKFDRPILAGDKITMSIFFDKDVPRKIWVAMRGEDK